jgi:hypothetical protein
MATPAQESTASDSQGDLVKILKNELYLVNIEDVYMHHYDELINFILPYCSPVEQENILIHNFLPFRDTYDFPKGKKRIMLKKYKELVDTYQALKTTKKLLLKEFGRDDPHNFNLTGVVKLSKR